MAKYSRQTIQRYLHLCNDLKRTAKQRGGSFEDLASYVFRKVPGVNLEQRDVLNVFQNQEIDLAFWNEKSSTGFSFLPYILLVECKNWYDPVSSEQVSWFGSKLKQRGLDFGILIANNGITGNARDLTSAHQIIANHLAEKRTILIMTRQEIQALAETSDFVRLMKEKLFRLVVSGE